MHLKFFLSAPISTNQHKKESGNLYEEYLSNYKNEYLT